MAMDAIHITSLDDPRVDPYRNMRDADLRGRERLFMAESELVVRRLLRTPARLHSLLLSQQKFDRLSDDISSARRNGGTFPIYVADVALISDVAGFHIHRGALAAGFRPTKEDVSLDNVIGHLKGSRQPCTILLAEGVTNVDNMGGLFRNAAAFGVDAIILDPTCCDPLYRKAIRVSVGHALVVPYAVSCDWQADIARLKGEWGLTLVGAESPEHDSHETTKRLWEIGCPDRVGIIFGSEANGLTEFAKCECDLLVGIPMSEHVSSLNVATAAAVFLYELCSRG